MSEASNHSLYHILLQNVSYPEGNFGGNQLLDSSISLSPLHFSVTNDLHVNTAMSFHLSFPRFHFPEEQFTIFRVLMNLLHCNVTSFLELELHTYLQNFFRLCKDFRSIQCQHQYQTPQSVFQDGSNLRKFTISLRIH